MGTFNKILMYIVYTNIIVAISAGILSAGFAYMMELDHVLDYGIFAGASTFVVYNGQRLLKSKNAFRTPWLQWVENHKVIIYSAVIASSVIAGYGIYKIGHFTQNSVLLLFVSGMLSAFYVVRIKGKSLRDIGHIKIHIISIAWVLVLLVFPYVNEGYPIDSEFIWMMVAHYLYIVGITIPFDIRDIKYDAITQKTLPQVMGVSESRTLSAILVVFFGAIMTQMFSPLGYSPLFYIAVIAQVVLLLMMKVERGDLYCAGLIDGAIAILGLSYFFF